MKAALARLAKLAAARAVLFLAQIERKVKAQITAGAVAGAAAYLLGHYVYNGQVPESVTTLIDVAAPWVAGAIAGWLAKHTPRTADAQ